MVCSLVEDLLQFTEISSVLVTQNIFEETKYPEHDRLDIIRNDGPRGYGANQNAAFATARTPFFCVLNPDICLKQNPFPALLPHFVDGSLALAGPKIVNPSGVEEDSARREPTFRNLFAKALGKDNGTYPKLDGGGLLEPDWLAGMFMLFRSEVFEKIGGFDQRYFLYYEDVDLCKRLRIGGYKILQDRGVEVTHHARRESRRNWRYARWHLASMVRYLIKYRAV
jgi:N-acetylglucosaminyl-diphospho-decaprenol L-rhamnosyltransferase